ncbi:Ger(x)C family spore germination protein [Salirhabdus salicampi]|uniref:Ger(x)C family spore germination protein n=1 Tax=Salirhabdus salicampi TaxID=476102 RepID=UPI0020C1BF92|nr:Ger(x)C family spore germination protein [Salirhabdus salicampi]MCP8615329.1 Ger(x)C family spore germination protein [Salirhabdus salicampi]
MCKRIKILSICIFVSGMLTGCWDRTEIDDINFILGMAIDKGEEEGYRVTYQWPSPELFSVQNPGQGSTTSFSVNGETITEAHRNITEISPRRPLFSHLETVIVGMEVAEESIANILDILGRQFQLRRTINIVLATNKAEDIIRSEVPFNKVSSTGITDLLNFSNRSSTYLNVTLSDFYTKYTDPDTYAYLPVVEIVSPEELTTLKQAGETGMVRAVSMAFINGGKIALVLPRDLSKAWLYTQGQIQKGAYTTSTIGGKQFSIRNIEQKGQTDVKIQNGTIKTAIKIKQDAFLNEIEEKHQQEINIEKLAHNVEKFVKEEVTRVVELSQKEGIDIFEIGRQVRENYPKKWGEVKKNWKEEYKQVEFDVEVKIEIHHTSALRKRGM